MVDTPLIRLTFNHPAQTLCFPDHPSRPILGVRMRIEGRNTVLFKPTFIPNAIESFELVSRGARGKQIILTEEMSETLMNVLSTDADIDNYPYYILKSDAQGWWRLQHHTGTAKEIRYSPHIRVWMPKEGQYTIPAAPTTQVDVPEFNIMLDTFTHQLRNANDTVSQFSEQRKLGRPPAEVQRAKNVLAKFTSLFLTEINPDLTATP